jgi:hypothetical protein
VRLDWSELSKTGFANIKRRMSGMHGDEQSSDAAPRSGLCRQSHQAMHDRDSSPTRVVDRKASRFRKTRIFGCKAIDFSIENGAQRQAKLRILRKRQRSNDVSTGTSDQDARFRQQMMSRQTNAAFVRACSQPTAMIGSIEASKRPFKFKLLDRSRDLSGAPAMSEIRHRRLENTGQLGRLLRN